MSRSSDDRRRAAAAARAADPDRAPARHRAGRVAPPPPRARAIDWDDPNTDPLSAPPSHRAAPPSRARRRLSAGVRAVSAQRPARAVVTGDIEAARSTTAICTTPTGR